MRGDAMQDEILMRTKSMPKKLLPKADWQLEVRDGFLYAGIYEHLGAVWFEKFALPNFSGEPPPMATQGEPTNAFYPPFRGVRVSKCDAGKWWFSRQIGMEAEWEETTFNDLFNLGIDIAYLESVVPGFSYYMRLAAVEFFTTKDM